MTEAPHVQAAFINAIREEGTKQEACDRLQKVWNENCALKKQIAAQREAALQDMAEFDGKLLTQPVCPTCEGTQSVALHDQKDRDGNAIEARCPDCVADLPAAATMKPLEWADYSTESLSLCGRYRVYSLDSGLGGVFRCVSASFGSQYVSDHRDATDPEKARQDAKAAAQAHHEGRILSCLTTQPDPVKDAARVECALRRLVKEADACGRNINAAWLPLFEEARAALRALAEQEQSE